MKRLFVITCVAVMVVLAVTAVQAQTCTTPEATLISPADGTTLQPDPGTGFINFIWCNASADYFVIIESQPGTHDIFYAFTGGVGPGAGQIFLTLPVVPSLPNASCQSVPPIGCITALGEHITLTLQTVKAKAIIGSHVYNFAAPSPAGKVATTTAVGAASTSSSSADQFLTLTATVTSTATVNQGTVTFQLLNGATKVGAAVTSTPLTVGIASVQYLLPGGTAAGSYTIQASYSGGANFNPSNGSGTLTVNAPPPVPAATTTTADPQSVTSSSAAQNVTLTAIVCLATNSPCTTSTVNEGTVTFQVRDGAANPVGTPVSSATVNNGSASAVYSLPANTAPNRYTIQVSYSDGLTNPNFAPSTGSGTLTVNAAPPPNQNTTATTASNNAVTFSSSIQHVTLTASVSGVDAVTGLPIPVNEGTVTFQVMDGTTNIGTAVPSATLTNNAASVNYALPAGTVAKNTYTIQAAYSGGTNFTASSSTGTLIVNKAQSTTTFTSTAPATLAFNGTYTPTATTTGDGVLTIGASGSCSIASGVVTITSSSGACTVSATTADGANWVGSSATPQTITATKAQSTTTFTSTAPATLVKDQTYTPIVTTTGDGVLTIGVGAGGPCSITGGVVTITATQGTCTVTATTADGNNFKGSSATPQTITVIPDFSFPTSPSPITISAPGGSGTTTVSILTQTGFTSATFACSGLPAKSSCSFGAPSVSGNTISTILTVTTTAPVVSMLKGAPGLNLWATGAGITLAGVFLGGIAGKRRRWSMLLGLLAVALLLTVVGCGSSHHTIPGTPPGTSTVTVTGTSGPLAHSTTFTLTVQ